MRLEIGLERKRLTFALEGTVENQLPWTVWGGRYVATFIVLLKTRVYIFCETDISLFWVVDAVEDIDEIHRLFLALFRGAASFRYTQLRRPTLRLLYHIAWPCHA